MSGIGRARTTVLADLRSLAREPFTLAALLVMPVGSIELYGRSVESMAGLGLFGADVALLAVGRVTGAVFAASALAGILGLFQNLSVRTADRRLVVAGFRRVELVAVRIGTVLATGLVVATVTTLSLAALVEGGVDLAGVAFAGLLVAAVTYGLLGVLVGSVLPRALEGSLVLVGLADVAAVLATGLFGIDPDLTRFFPLTHAHELVRQATVDGSVATAHVLPALAQLAVVAALTVPAYALILPSRGEGS